MSSRTIPVRMLLLALLLISVQALSGCKPSSLVSQSQEIEIGREAAQQVESQYKVVTNPQLNALVNNLGQRLAKCSGRPDLQYHFKILESKEVNAFSLPGGWIYVFTGLLNQTENRPDQLAGVLAHEIGHVAARHHAEMIGREIYANILLGTLTKGDVRQVAGIFANLSLLHYSREQEYEADKLGIRYMYRCGMNPEGLINFFNYLLTIQKNKPSEFEQIFLTHPVTEERIKRAREYLSALRSGKEQASLPESDYTLSFGIPGI